MSTVTVVGEALVDVVVAADGSLPLPPPALEAFPPGTLVRVHRTDDGAWQLLVDEEEER